MIYVAICFMGASLGLCMYFVLLLALHYGKRRERASMIPITRVDILA